MHASSSCCLVAIGRLQVTSTPNSGDLNSENSHEFVSRHSLDGEHLNFNLKMKLFNNKKYIKKNVNIIYLNEHFNAGNFTFVDHRIMQLMGYSPPELLGTYTTRYTFLDTFIHLHRSFQENLLLNLSTMRTNHI